MECDTIRKAKKHTNKNIKSKIQDTRISRARFFKSLFLSQDKNSDLKKELKNKDTSECRKKNIRNMLQEDSDLTEESKNEDTREVKCKNENIWNKKKKLQDKDSYLKKELENDTHRDKGIKMLQNENKNAKKALRNKNTCKAGSDEDVKEEYCSDATYLAQQMTSAERLGQAESKVIILKEIQFNKTCE